MREETQARTHTERREQHRQSDAFVFNARRVEQDRSILLLSTIFVSVILPMSPMVLIIGIFFGELCYRFKILKYSRQPTIKDPYLFEISDSLNSVLRVIALAYGLVFIYNLNAFPQSELPDSHIVIAVLIVLLSFVNWFDMGLTKYLRKKGLASPWSSKNYNDLDYREARLALEHDFERGYLLTRELAFEEIEEGIRKSTKFSNLQKKALLTRLGIQKNHMLHEEILASKTKSQENKSQPTAST